MQYVMHLAKWVTLPECFMVKPPIIHGTSLGSLDDCIPWRLPRVHHHHRVHRHQIYKPSITYFHNQASYSNPKSQMADRTGYWCIIVYRKQENFKSVFKDTICLQPSNVPTLVEISQC